LSIYTSASRDLTVESVWLEKFSQPGQRISEISPRQQFDIVIWLKNSGDVTAEAQASNVSLHVRNNPIFIIGRVARATNRLGSLMVEPLLHFAVPFASLKAIGVDLRKAVFASLVALIPDLDVLLHLHRSQSHSVIVLLGIALPLWLVTRKRKRLNMLVLLGTFGVLTHLIFDLFQAATPLFWPLVQESFFISTMLNLGIGSGSLISGSPRLVTERTKIEPFVSFDEPLLTAQGLAVSAILLTPTFVEILAHRLRRPKQEAPQ